MRKAKSLLALVLAMLTLLAFLPTALADETAHAVTLTHGEHVSVKGEAPTTTTPGADLVIEYKSDHAEFVPDKPTVTIGGNSYTGFTLTEADTDGYRKLTISDEALTGDVTIHLTASGKMYPVKFISEEGTTNMPGDATAAYGSTYTLPQNVPARTGKAFKGWKAVNGGTYQPGGTYTSIPSGGETFTALWEDKAAATLTYANGGYAITLPQGYTGYVGEETSLTIDYVNKGKSAINNVEATISGDIDSPTPYQRVGTIDGGKNGTIAFAVTPQLEGENQVKIVITYEDSNGNTKERVFEATVEAMAYEPADPGMDDPGMIDPEPANTFPWKYVIIAVVAALIVLLIVLRIRKKKAKQKAEQALWDKWDEEELAEEKQEAAEAAAAESKETAATGAEEQNK